MNKTKKKILSLILLAVFLVSTGLLIRNVLGYQAGDAAYDDARNLAAGDRKEEVSAQPSQTEPAPTQPAQPRTAWVPVPIEGEDPNVQPLLEMDLKALQQENPDILGWIQIPGTVVDYPVLQGEDNQFYLNHNWRGDKYYVGAIFLEHRNSPDMTDFNTIVYGHNMSNGSMFGSLYQYRHLSHWEEHPYVYILTESGVLRYEVFSTYTAEVESDTYRLGFRQQETRENYIAMALENSEIDTGIQPKQTDRILTLSTCSGAGYATRRVVHARLEMMEVELNG